jgi:hypothetical protein
MSPMGRPAGAGGQNPASSPVLAAGEGRGKDLGATGSLFESSVDGERLPVGGAPAASGGGRRGCPAGEVGARLGLCTGWRARVGAGEVEERPPWLAVGRHSQLAAAFGWAPADSESWRGGRRVAARGAVAVLNR